MVQFEAFPVSIYGINGKRRDLRLAFNTVGTLEEIFSSDQRYQWATPVPTSPQLIKILGGDAVFQNPLPP